MNKPELKLNEKYMLTIREAAEYFNVGTKKIRRMARRLAEDNLGGFSVFCGNRYLIIRVKFEEYMINIAKRKIEEDIQTDE